MQENTILERVQLYDVVVKFVMYKPLIAKSTKAASIVILLPHVRC